MSAYYNEIDPYAAQWLRNLVARNLIAPGDVDERSITDVRPDDLKSYQQCHFFAGIGGWSVALRLAGWPDDRPVWTGSCPCQPFSAAGAGKAANDERHLWPKWLPLIAERHPATVFGEQVEAAVGWGWLDAVFADLESQGYACGATVLPACSVGAPHIRQRLWFVAHSQRAERWPLDLAHRGNGSHALPQWQEGSGRTGSGREMGSRRAYADGGNASAEGVQRGGQHRQQPLDGGARDMADATRRGFGIEWDASRPRSGRHADGGFWSRVEWLPCTDGKARPVEPGSFPLAHGVQRRTSKLRAYGNAIVPEVAAEFITAADDSIAA